MLVPLRVLTPSMLLALADTMYDPGAYTSTHGP